MRGDLCDKIVAAVRKALASGADPNTRRTPLCPTWNKVKVELGPTALMLAMRGGNDEVAKLLLDKKADPLLKDQFDKNSEGIEC